MRSSQLPQAPQALQMNAHLTPTAATLTFVNPPIEPERNPHTGHERPSKITMKTLQKEFHPKIPESNFVRPFTTSDAATGKEQLGYTIFDSAFGSMAHAAFGQHKAIELRPDDIHLLIVQGFSRFLQQFPEDFRATVVPFHGKEIVKVVFDPSWGLEAWNELPQGFAGMIRRLINTPATADLLLQNYSQTTQMDRTVKAITLMGTFSAFFNYTAGTMCFIPTFILQGTVEDWAKIRAIPQQLIEQLKLTDCGLSEKENATHLLHRWLTRLQPHLENMYRARMGEVNPEFWRSFYKYNSHSGDDQMSGNIVYFYPFLKRENRRYGNPELQINDWILGKTVTLGVAKEGSYRYPGPYTSELPANVIDVDFQFQTKDTEAGPGETYDMGMKAGIIAYKESQRPDKAYQTHLDFSIFYKSRMPTIPVHSTATPIVKQPAMPVPEKMEVDAIKKPQVSNDPVAPAAPAPKLFKAPVAPARRIQFELVLNEEASQNSAKM